jgi:hypothetical protein
MIARRAIHKQRSDEMANRHERRKAAVFTQVTVPIAKLGRHRCAWSGCQESFPGDLPAGWCWLLSHTNAQAALDLVAMLDAIDLDIVLCPTHREALRAMLVQMPDPRLYGKPSK